MTNHRCKERRVTPNISANICSILGGNVQLIGGTIALTGEINESAGNRNLIIDAGSDITINNNITLGTGTLSLTAAQPISFGSGMSSLMAGALSFVPARTCNTRTTPSCIDIAP